MVNRIDFLPRSAPVPKSRKLIHKIKNNIMKTLAWLLPLALLTVTLSGCSAIGDIFKAGIWVGIIVVVAVVAIIAFLIKMFKS